MPAIGGLTAANGVVKIAGGEYTKIYEQTAEVYNRAYKGKGTPFGSRGFEIPTETSGVFTHGFPTDGGPLPAGESVQTIRPVVYATRYMHAVQITGASMEELSKAVNRKDFSYIDSWTSLNLDNVVESAHKMFNIYLNGTGNGRLGTVSAGAASTTQTFSNNDNTRYLRRGMRIQIWDPTFTTLRGTAKITSDPQVGATTVTLDTSITSTTGDFMTIAGGPNRPPVGLQHIIDDGTLSSVFFQNTSRTTVPKYCGQIINANNTSLSMTTLRKILGAKIFPAMGTLKRGDYEIWSHDGQWSQISSLGWTLKRYDGASKSIDLGYTTLEWEGIPWVTEVDQPKDQVKFINWGSIQKFVTKDWGWDETGGDIWNRIPSTTAGSNFNDQFEAYYDCISNLGCPDPRVNGAIIALVVPAGW